MHFLSLSSVVVVVVVVVVLFITINLSIRLLHHQCSYFLPFAFVLMLYLDTFYSTDALKLSGMRQGIQQIKDYYLNLNKQTFLLNVIAVDFMFG